MTNDHHDMMRTHLARTSAQAAGDQAAAPPQGDDRFSDPAIATYSMTLWDQPDGGMTSAAQLLIRPLDVRCDESGEHPGERFVMVTITREELRDMLAELDADWEETVQFCGDPNEALKKAAAIVDHFKRTQDAAKAMLSLTDAQIEAGAMELGKLWKWDQLEEVYQEHYRQRFRDALHAAFAPINEPAQLGTPQEK